MGGEGMSVAQKMLEKKIKSQLAKKAVYAFGTDKIGENVLKDTTEKSIGKIAGIGMLFFEFVDAYSKAVKEANLEHIRQRVEFCPHIGGLQGAIEAMNLVHEEEVTAWIAVDGFYYFHPQPNYRVRGAMHIYRFLPNGDLSNNCAIEYPGKAKVRTQDCLACVEAHAGGAD